MTLANTMPLVDFLNKSGLSLLDYLCLDDIPYPIVSSDGNMLYFDPSEQNIYLTNCDTSHPRNLQLRYLDLDSYQHKNALNRLYVDFNVFEKSKGNLLATFRYLHDPVDLLQSVNLTQLELETKTSSTKIRINKNTGRISGELYKYHNLDSYSYSFDPYDLVNTYDPILDFIIQDKVEFIVLNNKLSFSIKQNSNSNSSGDNMSTSNSAQTIGTNTVVQNVIDKNKESLLIAAKLEVGGLALNLITEQLIKQLPEHFQFLLQDNPLIKVAISNLVNVVVQSMNVQDARILAVNDAMITASWIETVSMFNFQEIINTALSKLPESKVSTLVAEVQA